MTNPQELFDAFADEMSLPWMLSQTEALWKIELGQRTREHRRSARFAEQLLNESGLQQVQRLTFPADGKTAYLDRVMPLAWDATVGRLTVTRSPIPFYAPVVADYDRHPFHLIHGSVSTPSGGVTTRLISEEQMYAGEDARGAMVLLAPETRPYGAIVRDVCDLGALGLVSDHLKHRYDTPDGICWVNACTEGAHWHVHEDDRPFVGFSVSPRVGDQLHAAVRAGKVQVHVESDGRRYEDELDLVTGVVPGEDPRELWLLSHLYEPMPNDNSTGCIAAIEVARAIQRMTRDGRLPRPRFTLRVVLGMETYGFAAYAHRRGVELRDQVLGALNMDTIVGDMETLRLAPAGMPFCGDYVIEELSRACQGRGHLPPHVIDDRGSYGDDMLMNDPTIGVPTIWPPARAPLWHNSQQSMARIDPKQYLASAAFRAAWTAQMLTLAGERLDGQVHRAALLAEEHLHQEAMSILQRTSTAAPREPEMVLREARCFMGYRSDRETQRLANFARFDDRACVQQALTRVRRTGARVQRDLIKQLREMIGPNGNSPTTEAQHSDVRRLAATIVPARATAGMPHDLARVPKAERRRLPSAAYFHHVLGGMDGERTLETIVREAAWQAGREVTPALLRSCIGAVEYLSEHGYLHTHFEDVVTQNDIVAALRRVGLREGQLVLMHSALSPLGHVEGGPEAVIDAVREVIGEAGTLLMPAFSRSEIVVDGSAPRSRQFRPYNPKTSRPWVGRVPSRFLHYEGVVRSAHPTHSVAGLGPLAADCLDGHRESHAPFSSHSPFGRMLEHDAKMIWVGADLSATTLFHLLECETRMPFLADVLCRVERPNGNLETVHVPGYPAGHRDYYREPGEATKIYQRLLNDGLKIRRTRVGQGEVRLVDAQQMYRLGLVALADDPGLLLCDQPACAFCRRYACES